MFRHDNLHVRRPPVNVKTQPQHQKYRTELQLPRLRPFIPTVPYLTRRTSLETRGSGAREAKRSMPTRVPNAMVGS